MGLFSKLQAYSIGLIAAAVFCSSFCSTVAYAKVVLLGTPSGASAVIKTVSGGTTPTTVLTIYAGFAGTCATTNGFTTCDSCDAGTPIVDTGTNITYTMSPCNFKNAYTNLKLHIELTTSGLTTTPNLFLEANGKDISASATKVFAGTTMTVEIPWGNICAAESSGGATDCTTMNYTGNLEIGVKPVSGGTGTQDTITIPFVVRSMPVTNNTANVTTNWFYHDCPPGQIGTANEGFCHFKAYKGDSKVYADELLIATTLDATPVSVVKYNNLVFFYEEQIPADGGSDAATVARITTKSPRSIISLNTTLKPPAADNRITGLANGSRYCFIMANQDSSGVIYYFTPTQTTTPPSVTPASLCATPEKVVGLLDDKSCFIATAAFGSDMAPEVQSFRDFRNEYLFSNSMGKEFVRFYYKHSPFYANLIAQNDVARATVRVALWPLLLFAKVSVQFGLWAGILLLLSSVGLVVFAYRRVKSLSKLRGLA